MSDWSDKKLTLVRAVWGMLVGTALFAAAVNFVPHLIEGGLTRDELLLSALFLGVGMLAASPATAFQLIGKGIEFWTKRKGGE